MSKTSFVTRLGPQWRAFAYEREGMRFFGVVQRGAAGVGALAKTDDGWYVQVNGDVVEALNPRRVRGALRMRDKTEGRCTIQPLSDRLIADLPRGASSISAPGNTPPASVPGPVVTVKKKRHVAVPATTDAASASERAGVGPAA